jgi:predicted ATPase
MLNVLIGSNGAGKSNFIGFFKFVKRILDQQLQVQVAVAGGPDAILHFGRKTTPSLSAELRFGNNGYNFSLNPTDDNRLFFGHEALWWNLHGDYKPQVGHLESLVEQFQGQPVYNYVVPVIKSWRVYHFHDTGSSASVKRAHGINDNLSLREDAENLASVLFRLKATAIQSYDRIVSAVRLVAPYFHDFNLRPIPQNPDKIQLEWFEKGQEVPFLASALSDGTLRFICLATVLLQPDELMPDAMLIDEPELGLHPYAIQVLASLMKSASLKNQLIISTQSVELVNEFAPEDIIVADRENGASVIRRISADDVAPWLEDYSLGEVWKKNLIGGRPE